MNKVNYKTSIYYCVLIITMLACSVNLFAQKDTLAKDMAKKLKEKVLLEDSQAKNIEIILDDYISAKADNNAAELKKIKDSVSDLLDKKQKMKFEVIKSSWWNEIDAGAGAKNAQ